MGGESSVNIHIYWISKFWGTCPSWLFYSIPLNWIILDLCIPANILCKRRWGEVYFKFAYICLHLHTSQHIPSEVRALPLGSDCPPNYNVKVLLSSCVHPWTQAGWESHKYLRAKHSISTAQHFSDGAGQPGTQVMKSFHISLLLSVLQHIPKAKPYCRLSHTSTRNSASAGCLSTNPSEIYGVFTKLPQRSSSFHRCENMQKKAARLVGSSNHI